MVVAYRVTRLGWRYSVAWGNNSRTVSICLLMLLTLQESGMVVHIGLPGSVGEIRLHEAIIHAK